MKNFKRILALVLAVMMVVTCMVSVSAADEAVEAKWNDVAISRLQDLDIFVGDEEGKLEPEKNVSRVQMAVLTSRVMTGKVDRLYWESYVNDTTFLDIENTYAEGVGAIAYAYENGIVKGKSAERFDPNGNVTYRDALAMVVRSLGYDASYPNGIINKAIKLGLTNGISGVEYTAEATRGVVATILYNALYAEDSLFAKNFDLSSGVYMLVATPAVQLATQSAKAGKPVYIDAATIEGYNGKTINAGFVAFAPIDENNRAVNGHYVYAKTSQISDDFDVNFANRLGYAYELTFEGDQLAWANQCKTDVFVNYGDKAEITAENYAYKENGSWIYNEYFLTFGGQSYDLTDGYDAEHTAPTNTKDLILYNGFASADVNEYRYYYDAKGNVVTPDGSEVKLYKGDNIGKSANVYYVETTAGTYVEASEQDFYDALSACGVAVKSAYDILVEGETVGNVLPPYNATVTSVVKTIAENNFCEIAAMDYDGDGEYDAAIYTPYFIGVVNKAGNRTDTKMQLLTAQPYGEAHSSVSYSYNALQMFVGDFTVTGEVTSLAADTWILYTFNPLNNEIRVIENVGKTKWEQITWASKGGKVVDGVYTDSKAKINGVTYKIGGWDKYDLHGVDQQELYSDYGQANVWASRSFQSGWNDMLVEAMNTAKYKAIAYVALADHIIWAYPVKVNAAAYSFVAFDPYTSEFAVDNDQIVVKALTDATGEYKEIKVNAVYGQEFTNIEYTAFCAYIDILYKNNADLTNYGYYFSETMKAKFTETEGYKAVLRATIIEKLYEATEATLDTKLAFDGCAENFQGTLIYSVDKKNADGSYDLDAIDTLPASTKVTSTTTVTFQYGKADVRIPGNSNLIATDDETVFTFIAKNGIYTYVGKPEYDAQLVLNAGAIVYVANSDQIMIIDEAHDIDEIAKDVYDYTTAAYDAYYGLVDTVYYDFAHTCGVEGKLSREHNDTWKFVGVELYFPAEFYHTENYLIIDETSHDGVEIKDGVYVSTYKNLYDLVNNKKVTLTVVGAEAEAWAVFYETAKNASGKAEAGIKYGTIVWRDTDINGVTTVGSTTDWTTIFRCGGDFFIAGTLGAVDKDNNGAYAHVTISGDKKTVTSVRFYVVVVNSNGTVSVTTDFSKAATGCDLYYYYDVETGALSGWAINAGK